MKEKGTGLSIFPHFQDCAELRNWDYGVYVTGLVKLSNLGMPVNFLVDTGAAATVMSLLAYKRLPTDIQPALEPAEFELDGVSGNTLELVGTARMTLVFQGAAFTQDIPIIDIPVEAILGQDILLEQNGRLDLSNLTLRLCEVLIPCWIAGGSAMTCKRRLTTCSKEESCRHAPVLGPLLWF